MRRLFLLAVMSSLALPSLAVGSATAALFSDRTETGDQTFAAGTVSVGAVSSTVINIGGIIPGRSGQATYTVAYTGSLPAWLGVDTKLEGNLATCHEQDTKDHGDDPADDRGDDWGEDADDSHAKSDKRFKVTVTDRFGNAYDPNASNQVILTGPGQYGTWTKGESPFFTVDWSLGKGAGNSCKHKTGMLTLEVHGVQAIHNTNATGTGPVSWY